MLPAFVVTVLLIAFSQPEDVAADPLWPKAVLSAIWFGYLVSTGALLVGALIAAFLTHDWPAMWSALGYAAVGLLVLGPILYSVFYPSPTK
jgi:hypothetical protein